MCQRTYRLRSSTETEQGMTVNISVMDSLTTREEVISEIEREAGARSIIRCRELRPNARKTQAITVKVERMAADTLLNRGWIRIGLVICKIIEERVNVKSCRKCWYYVHKTTSCEV